METERIVAADKGNINRESTISQKRLEAEQLRDEIAAGFNKLRKRQCVFGGSSNTLDFLPLDRTGNRRFVPVMVYPETVSYTHLDVYKRQA